MEIGSVPGDSPILLGKNDRFIINCKLRNLKYTNWKKTIGINSNTWISTNIINEWNRPPYNRDASLNAYYIWAQKSLVSILKPRETTLMTKEPRNDFRDRLKNDPMDRNC